MDKELRYFLEQGGHQASELARKTGKSVSAIYKALKHPEVLSEESPVNGRPVKIFWIKPSETPVEAPGAIVEAESTPPSVEAPVVAPVASKGRGRPATAGGKKLFFVIPSQKQRPLHEPINPRRPNSHGYRSLQIIIDNPGITTEEFVAKGGRLNDLRWDISYNRVKAEG